MIVEELVARLGFQVFGEDRLRTAGKAMQFVREKILQFSRSAARDLSKAEKGLDGLGSMAQDATGAARGLSTVLGGLTRTMAGFAAPAAGMTAGLGVIAVALNNVGARAAAVRREMQLLAGGSGTTAARTDQLSAFVGRLTGADPEEALKATRSWLGKLQDLQTKAIGGDPDAVKAFNDAGLGASITEKDGMPRDTALLAMDTVQGFKTLQERAQKARESGNAKATTEAIAKLLQFAERFGFDDKFRAALSLRSSEQVQADFAEANRRSPTQTPAQETRDDSIARDWRDISGVAREFGKAATEATKNVAATITPILKSGADTLLDAGQSSGVLPITEEQRQARERAARDKRERETESLRENNRALGLTGRDLRSPNRKMQDAIRQDAEEREQRERTRQMRDEAGPSQRFRPMPPPKPAEPVTSALPSPAPIPQAPAPKPVTTPALRPAKPAEPGMLQQLFNFFRENPGAVQVIQPGAFQRSNEQVMSRTLEGMAQKIIHQNIENVGNDNRTVNVSVSAAVQGMPGLGTTVQGAVNSALVKGSNASTDAITTP
jgi:hypothetical protein